MKKKGDRTPKGALPLPDWELYERGKEYNRKIDFYENANKNERFFRGDQWNGVKSGGLPTPVFNIFKRIINHFVSSIMSQKISMNFSFDGAESGIGEIGETCGKTAAKISDYFNYRYDRDGIEELLSDSLFDAALFGDAYLYVFWDTEQVNSQGYLGDFKTVTVDPSNVFFGDVNSCDIERQPYIIISGRDLVSRLREEGARNGLSEDELKAITADNDTLYEAGDFGKEELPDSKCTYIIKLFKKDGRVHYTKLTRNIALANDVNTGLRRYPITMMNWDKVKNSYHGQALATGLIDNQVYINKAFAMVMKHMMNVSFSKVVYDQNLIDEWTNGIGEAIAVNGPVERAVTTIDPGSMQPGFLDVISMTLSVTKDLLGATDSALGSAAPTNTSAIVALQKASSVPLDNQKRALWNMVKRLGLIWLDFVSNYYSSSRKIVYRNLYGVSESFIDLKQNANASYICSIDVGPSNSWSETASIATLDSLLSRGAITFEEYLERMPDGYIPEKERLIESRKSGAAAREEDTLTQNN